MPTTISDVDTWTDTVQTPNDGEVADRSSLELNFLQGLANRTRYLYNSNFHVTNSDRRVVIPLWAMIVDPSVNGWTITFKAASNGFTRPILNQQNNPFGGVKCYVPIYMPVYRGRVVFVHIRGQGSPSHGAIPATRPSVNVMRLDQNGEPFRLHNFFLGSGVLGAYTAVHDTIATVPTGATQNLNGGDNCVYLEIIGEHGSNSLAFGYTIYGASITFGPQIP